MRSSRRPQKALTVFAARKDFVTIPSNSHYSGQAASAVIPFNGGPTCMVKVVNKEAASGDAEVKY